MSRFVDKNIKDQDYNKIKTHRMQNNKLSKKKSLRTEPTTGPRFGRYRATNIERYS